MTHKSRCIQSTISALLAFVMAHVCLWLGIHRVSVAFITVGLLSVLGALYDLHRIPETK